MRRPLRVLTTDRVPGFVHALATLAHAAPGTVARLDVIVPDPGDPAAWWTRQREVPASARAVRPATAARGLDRGAYDAVIAHGLGDAARLHRPGLPLVVVHHETRELLDAQGDGPDTWPSSLAKALASATRIYTNAQAAASWAVPGTIIAPAVDPLLWPLGDLSRAEAVTVAPFAIERAATDIAYALAEASREVPITVLGLNPSLGITGDTASRARRRDAFRTHRAYVNLVNPHLEGPTPYPLLEAMAAGLPIVTLRHPESPVVDGVNGFACDDPRMLGARLRLLMEHPVSAIRLGTAARRSVFDRYSLTAFQAAWIRVLDALAAQPARRIA
ncbi:MAG: glycosyltransferase [Acidobacteriota bacterium]